MKINQKRWLVLGASLFVSFCIGTVDAWSVYAGPLSMTFGWTAAATASIFTIANSVAPICMIAGGKLQDSFGPRWVVFGGGILFGGGIILSGFTTSLTWIYISYGIITGLGGGLAYSSVIANAVKFFPDKRGLVAGLVTGGAGFGPVLIAPISQQLITTYGVLHTFKILGAAYLVILLVGSQLIKKAPVEDPAVEQSEERKRTADHSGRDKTWRQMLADPLFYLLVLLLMAGTISGLMMISQVSPMVQEVVGVPAEKAALAVSLMAVASMTGRILWGAISDKIGRFRTLPVMYLTLALAMFGLTAVSRGQFVLFVVCAMSIGFCFGGLMSVFPALTADCFGAKNNGVNYGLLFMGFALGAMIGPIMAATIKSSNNGDYSKAFFIAAVISSGAVLLTFLVKKMDKAR